MDNDDVSVVLDGAREAMEKSLRSLRHELQKIRTGRASTAILEGITAEYYGTQTPLNQLANLSTPDPRLIVISPYDKGVLSAIERAVQSSDLGLTPGNDGKVIRIPIPSLTEERRKELVKQVHRLAEHHRVGVREARRDGISLLKDLESEGLPADERRRMDRKVQELTDDYVKKIDGMSAQKETEIMEV